MRSPTRWPTIRSSRGDRVALLGFTSVDYTCLDMALIALGAVSVPLQTSAPVAQLQPIVAETEPTAIAASVDYLADAVELVLAGPQPARLIVFDYRPQVDDHRDAVAAAKIAPGRGGQLDTTIDVLGDVIARGAKLPAVQPISDRRRRPADPAGLHLRQHRCPKGAMYTERMVADSWGRSAWGRWGDDRRTARDHPQLHADEPRDGPRCALLPRSVSAVPRISPRAAIFRRSSRTSRWCDRLS